VPLQMLLNLFNSCLLRRAGWLALAIALSGCSTPGPPAAPAPAAEAAALPIPPWRDRAHLRLTSGHLQWTDASRDRTITAQWKAPQGTAGTALLLVLPGLAQGSTAPAQLIEVLAAAGFGVVTVGHPGNDVGVWQGADARRADFTQAARTMYAAAELTERVADVRYVLDSLEKQTPAWLRAGATRRVGIVGIGLGAQTAQALLGEAMSRSQQPTVEARVAAAALLAPYVGFEGPAMYQRYDRMVTPLLVAYGLNESDRFGLGMTPQQRRAMVAELRNARVVELRLPTASSVGTLEPDAGGSVSGASLQGPGSAIPHGDASARGRDPRGGPASGVSPSSGNARIMTPGGETGLSAEPPNRANERVSRVALLLSVTAFFEAELMGSADARDWLEGPHPGPARWTVYPAGRAPAPGGVP
jgi:dienelactone hydrolase